MIYGHGSVGVAVEDQVATVRMLRVAEAMGKDPRADVHWELQALLNELREDHSVRVIVLTGAHDGEFLIPGETADYGDPASHRLTDPAEAWKLTVGVTRLHVTMAEIEKPIVAKVNGDAIGFGQSIMFSSDLIVAREDAIVNEVHLGQGEVTAGPGGPRVGPPFGVVPGDGAGATVPLFMSPVKAKEYLMLSADHTAAELAEMNCINYAVPADRLDAKVDELVARLLRKSAQALARTKRIANRHVLAQLNQTLDAGMAYELVDFLQAQRPEGRNRSTLT